MTHRTFGITAIPMKVFKIALLPALVFLAALSIRISAASADQLVDRIIASVGGEPVTLLELQRFQKALGTPQSADLQEGSPQFQKALHELLLNRMMEREAEDAGISIGEDEIAAYIEEIRRQNQVDEQGFLELLRSKGLTKDQYIAQIKGDILKSRVVSAKVRNQVNVVDEDIARYLNDHPELKPNAGSMHLIQVRIPLASVESPEKANEIAEALKSQLEDGKAVDELRIPGAGDGARSPGQDLGFVTLSDLRSEITAAVKDLDAGQVSDVVEFAAAKYVFRIAAKADSEGAVDEVTREKIRTQIFQTKFEERLRLFFDEELPKKYQVELIAAKAK